MYQRTKIEDYIWTDREFWAPFAECATLCSQLQPATNLFGGAPTLPSKTFFSWLSGFYYHKLHDLQASGGQVSAKQKDDNSFGWSPLSFLGICIVPVSIVYHHLRMFKVLSGHVRSLKSYLLNQNKNIFSNSITNIF